MMQVTIGKFTLESLTTGMYSDPRVIFREYIQNAVDSLDEAFDRQMLRMDEGRIDIHLSKEKRFIIIQDNGCGIPEWQAPRVLMDIGNSKKRHISARGFRGIGRLAGLGHAQVVTFQTSFSGEPSATIIRFDAEKLQQLMIPGQADTLDLSSLLAEVTDISVLTEEKESHYFRVILEGVKQNELLHTDEVSEFLRETAPIPYDSNIFSWGPHIRRAFTDRGLELREYSIWITDDSTNIAKPLFKPFRDEYIVDKQKKLIDRIDDLEIKEIQDSQGKLLAIVWIGKSQLLGGILNSGIRGLRFRKGNIMIGNHNTMNSFFKEDRFNGWFQGEIFVINDYLIPNARRDDFERNSAYLELCRAVEEYGYELSKVIRHVSAKRNNWRKRGRNFPVDYTEEDLIIESDYKEITSIVDGFEALKTVRMISGDRASTKYAALNLSQRLTIAEKKMLEIVFDSLLEEMGDQGQQMLIKLVDRLRLL